MTAAISRRNAITKIKSMFNLHDEIQKSGERLKENFPALFDAMEHTEFSSFNAAKLFKDWYAAEQLALAKKIVEELRPSEIPSDGTWDKIAFCAKCRKKFCDGAVVEWGESYPGATVENEDGSTKEIPASRECKKALCVNCLIAEYDFNSKAEELMKP